MNNKMKQKEQTQNSPSSQQQSQQQQQNQENTSHQELQQHQESYNQIKLKTSSIIRQGYIKRIIILLMIIIFVGVIGKQMYIQQKVIDDDDDYQEKKIYSSQDILNKYETKQIIIDKGFIGKRQHEQKLNEKNPQKIQDYQQENIYDIQNQTMYDGLTQQQKNKKMKQLALDKYYSDGLKYYYQAIQNQIQIVKIQFDENGKKQNKKISLIINGLFQCEENNCIKSIESVLNLKQNLMEILWVVKKQKTQQIKTNISFNINLKKYLTNKQYIFTSSISIVNSTNQFLIKSLNTKSELIILLKNTDTINNIKFDQINGFITERNLSHFVFSSTFKLSTFINIKDIYQRHQTISKQSILIFKPQLLKIISPINFAYQNIYTFQQLIIFPIIGLSNIANKQLKSDQQLNIQKLISFETIKYDKKEQKDKQQKYTQFRLQILYNTNVDKQQNQHICFIVYPTNPTQNQINQVLDYLNEFHKTIQLSHDAIQSISLLIILKYPSKEENLDQVIQKIVQLSKMRLDIRIKFRHEKVLGPLQIYEAAYSYCPRSSVMFNSRFNVLPKVSQIIKSVNKHKICKNKNYLLISHYLLNKKQVKLGKIFNISPNKRYSYISNFSTHFKHAQIFCWDLMVQMRLQMVKWQQLQFYQTQACLALTMLQRTELVHTVEQNILYQVKKDRKLSQKQKIQLKGLELRDKKKPISQKQLDMVLYSQLNNHAYKRNPKQLIPPIIHQIWLSDAKQMSKIRKVIAYTLIKTNPQFKYRLWTLQDMTREKFPITYDGILKFQKIQKQKNKNYKALIADLMRIQILYKFGGIYCDLKIQGKKSLKPFLKYEQFYFIANKQNVVNGLIGSIKGNRHFRIMLQDFFKPQNLHAPIRHIYQLTGGTKLVQAYNLQQIYTQVYSFHQFIFDGPRPCIFDNLSTNPDVDQQVFRGTSGFVNKLKYKILVPCKKDMEKYLEIYDILGRTYFAGAQPFS